MWLSRLFSSGTGDAFKLNTTVSEKQSKPMKIVGPPFGLAWVLPVLLWLGSSAAVQAQFTYVTNNGAITITGWTGPVGPASIPEIINGLPVTAIGDSAFSLNSNVTSVVIGDRITQMGMRAFFFCTNLASVTIGTGLTNIETYAFYNCSNLTQVVLGTNVESIGDLAFCGSTKLAHIHLPDSLLSLGESAFSFSGLTNITVPNSVKTIEDEAFANCYRLQDAQLSTGITTLSPQLFRQCTNLVNFVIPSSVTNVGYGAFELCTCLSGIIIPSSVRSIDYWAFEFCSGLKRVTISYGVTDIGLAAFADCSKLSNLTIPGSVTNIGGAAFSSDENLAGLFFQGNAPSAGWTDAPTNLTAYYLPSTTGWQAFTVSSGIPTTLWNPQAQTSDGGFGVQTNQFGFNITGTTNIPIVVEASTNLAGAWVPLQSVSLTNGSFHFSDPQWTNYPGRFYRIRSP